MDGHNREESVPPPAGLMDVIRGKDPKVIALQTLSERAGLAPVSVPDRPLLSTELEKLMQASYPSSVPADLAPEHRAFCKAIMARADAKAENKRRLRTALWCEQALRSQQRPEHRIMRQFNMEMWGVQEEAPHDYALREQLVEKHA